MRCLFLGSRDPPARAKRELPEGHEQPLLYLSSPRSWRSLREFVVTSGHPRESGLMPTPGESAVI